jgi:hypothetical protein
MFSGFDDMVVGHNMKMEYVPKKASIYAQAKKPESNPKERHTDDGVENVFQSKVQSHKERVAKIRKARHSAELIRNKVLIMDHNGTRVKDV